VNAFSHWSLLLFGIAFGACLPVAIAALHERLRRIRFKPTLLHLDPLPPARRSSGPGSAAGAHEDAPDTHG
jgi:hypothetical protein